ITLLWFVSWLACRIRRRPGSFNGGIHAWGSRTSGGGSHRPLSLRGSAQQLGRATNEARIHQFSAEDRPQVNGLRLLAANPSFDIEFYDESVRVATDSTTADYIRRKIREKINRTSVTLCMVSALTYTALRLPTGCLSNIDAALCGPGYIVGRTVGSTCDERH